MRGREQDGIRKLKGLVGLSRGVETRRAERKEKMSGGMKEAAGGEMLYERERQREKKVVRVRGLENSGDELRNGVVWRDEETTTRR